MVWDGLQLLELPGASLQLNLAVWVGSMPVEVVDPLIAVGDEEEGPADESSHDLVLSLLSVHNNGLVVVDMQTWVNCDTVMKDRVLEHGLRTTHVLTTTILVFDDQILYCRRRKNERKNKREGKVKGKRRKGSEGRRRNE